jgi:tRNA-dihydrouridine synthase
MGCPFPLQTRHGKGSGILSHPDKVADVLGAIPQLIDEGKAKHFSLKMRLGQEQPDEWMQLIDTINKAPLEHVTIHPRIGTQQYKGEIFMDEFEKFVSECSHPIIYNGDIRTPEDITTIEQRFPNLAGVMIGRGLLARPSLAVEYATGETWSEQRRLSLMREMHNQLFDHYKSIIPGEEQLLSKIRTFWEYAEEEIGRKNWKKLMKCGNLKNYIKNLP